MKMRRMKRRYIPLKVESKPKSISLRVKWNNTRFVPHVDVPLICARCGCERRYKNRNSFRAVKTGGCSLCNSCSGIVRPRPLVSKTKGKNIHTEATKEKFRQRRIDQIKASGQSRTYNENACDVLDVFNGLFANQNIHFQHALNGGELDRCGYYADGYDATNNIWFEWDEKRHFNKGGVLKPKDVRRMEYIIRQLNPEYWRYDEERKVLKQCNPKIKYPIMQWATN